jgi:type IV secretory pathway VirB2 component (pilin)
MKNKEGHMKNETIKIKTNTSQVLNQYMLCALAFVGVYAASTYAVHAGAGTVLCNLIINEMFTGMLGKAIATIGVLIVGVGAALGRVSWTMAVTVAVGISCMFAARGIAGALGGGC